MADTATDTGTHEGHGHAHDEHHPTELQYWVVFVSLAVLTAIEIAWSYAGLEGVALVVPLLVMMVVKFMLVGGAFMHLYFDLKILNGRFFTLAFAGAIALALAVYGAVIAAFQFNV
jgi:cytochrome c oxidase subunit IV